MTPVTKPLESSVTASGQPGRRLQICLAPSQFRPVVGGAERNAEILATALSRLGHGVTVVAQENPQAPDREESGGIRIRRAIHPISWGPLFAPSYAASLGWFLSKHRGKFDILQATYLYWDAVVAAMLKPLLGFRLVVRVVIAGPGGDLDRFCGMRIWPMISGLDRPTLERLVALVVRRADAVIAQNHESRKEMVALGVAPGRCHVVPNGIEVLRFAAPRPAHAGRGAIQLLCVGRLAEQKGLDVMLQALPAVRSAMGPTTLRILGEGHERGRLERLAAELGVASDVRFEGLVSDVRPYLSAAEVFVFPSRYEGHPHALLEAMAAGVPVVGTAVQGTIEVIRDGVEGLLVPPDDAGALARALVAVLQDEPLAARLAAGARARVASEFSVQKMVDRILRVYWETLRPIHKPVG